MHSQCDACPPPLHTHDSDSVKYVWAHPHRHTADAMDALLAGLGEADAAGAPPPPTGPPIFFESTFVPLSSPPKLMPPKELRDLQAFEVARLLTLPDGADTATLHTTAERLILTVIHCIDVTKALGIDDIRPDMYRNEMLVVALWILSLLEGE